MRPQDNDWAEVGRIQQDDVVWTVYARTTHHEGSSWYRFKVKTHALLDRKRSFVIEWNGEKLARTFGAHTLEKYQPRVAIKVVALLRTLELSEGAISVPV